MMTVETFATPEDLAAFVAARQEPVAIQGAGTKTGIGNRVDAPVISTLGLEGLTYFEPKEFVLGARAGTRLSALEALLAEHALILPFDPPRFGGDPTLGGVLASNLGGAERETLGSPRDSVLGLEYINGKGELLKAGGRVVKNVSGYDIPRGLSGSWGTLAIFTEITIKVVPKARAIDQETQGLKAVWGSAFVWRLSLPRDQAQGIIDQWDGPTAQQWDGALLWLGSEVFVDALALAATANGHGLLVQRPAEDNHPCFQAMNQGTEKLHRLFKQAFDPKGIFNPGRMYKDL